MQGYARPRPTYSHGHDNHAPGSERQHQFRPHSGEHLQNKDANKNNFYILPFLKCYPVHLHIETESRQQRRIIQSTGDCTFSSTDTGQPLTQPLLRPPQWTAASSSLLLSPEG